MTLCTGGTLTVVGGKRIHTFTADGTLVVVTPGSVEYLVVAGGGGGGGGGSTYASEGGGGAGGMRTGTLTLTAGNKTVTIGALGAGGVGYYDKGSNGGDSVLDSITSTGGAGAAGFNTAAASTGGSGAGGCGYHDVSGSSTGTAGTVGQGNKGGDGVNVPDNTGNGGGGGGAGGAGGNCSGTTGGAGGAGTASSISGVSVTYAAGGGGGGTVTGGAGGSSGIGGAGGTGNANGSDASPANRGSGGGGCGAAGSGGATNGGNGSAGIVIVSYWISENGDTTMECVDFPGTDEYIDCGSAATLDDISAKSIALWVYLDTVPDNNVKGFICKDSGDYWWLGFGDVHVYTANSLYFYQGFATADGLWTSAAGTLGAGAWNHLAVTHADRTSTSVNPLLYINGVSVAVTEITAPNGSANTDAAKSVKIGFWDGGSYVDGKMADIRVFNDVLTADEVLTLASGFPYRSAIGGEVLWIPCNSSVFNWDGAVLAAGNVVPDETGNANDGTPSGGPTGYSSDAPRFATWIARAFYNLTIPLDVAGTLLLSGARTAWNTSFGLTHAAGALTPTGAVNKGITTTWAGTLTLAGAVVKNWARTLNGTLSLAGGVLKGIAKSFAGTVTFKGAASGLNAVVILRKIFGLPNPTGKIKSGKRV